MSRYKILDLPTYLQNDLGRMFFEEEIASGYHMQIQPIFKRDGLYLDRLCGGKGEYQGNVKHAKLCWVEYDNGTKAALYEVKMFRHELGLENHRPLSIKERGAIMTLIQGGLASKQLKELYYLDTQWRDLRNIKRDTRK